MPSRKGSFTVQQAYLFIQKTVAIAETRFVLVHQRLPSLVDEHDYVFLADFLNIPEVDSQNRYLRKLSFSGDSYRRPAIPGHDITYVLLRRFLQRQGFFAGYKTNINKMLFDGLMGRLDYNVPSSEHVYRLEKLAKLRAMNIPFPPDFGACKEVVKHVGITCGLPTIYQKVYNRPEGDTTRKGWTHIGTCMVNPAREYFQLLELLDKHEYNVFIEYWQESYYPAKDADATYR